MLRQDVVHDVAQQLRAGHSQQAIVDDLKRDYPEEDIEDAFEAVGVRRQDIHKGHHRSFLAKFMFILVVAVVVGLVAGSLTYGFIKLKDKLHAIDVAYAKDQAPSPSTPFSSSSSSPSSSSSFSSPASSSSSPAKILAPPQMPPSPGETPQAPLPAQQPLAPTGFGRCALMQDESSPEAKACREQEALKLSGAGNCNSISEISTDPRLYNECSRAFFEMAQQPS